MSCSYLNKEKDSVWSGIYCNRIGDRPGNEYWSCYCNGRSGDCPHLGGSDPYMLHPDTRRRKQEEEDRAKAREVDSLINRIPSRITAADERVIDSAANAYDRLTYDQQKYVNGYYTLTSALRELENAKRKASSAESVSQMIARLSGHVTASDERLIRSARAAYDRLDYDQKRLVRNISVLENAERALEQALGNQKNRPNDESTKAYEFTNQEDRFDKKVELTAKQRIWHEIEAFVKYRLNPKRNRQSKMILTTRILLPVIAALCIFVDIEAIPPVIEWMYMVFCGSQLLCLALAYWLTDQAKPRLIVYGITALSLLVLCISVYLQHSGDIVLVLAIATFLVPLAWFHIKFLTWLAERLVKLF